MTTIRTAHHPFATAAPGKAFNITLWTLQVLVALIRGRCSRKAPGKPGHDRAL